ncbi:MAG: hypothetical protein ACOX6T_23050, partial [Myxococcales bacterium]
MTTHEANGQILVVGDAPARDGCVRELGAAGLEAVGAAFEELREQLARRRPDVLLVVGELEQASAALSEAGGALAGLPVLVLTSPTAPGRALGGLVARFVAPGALLAQVGEAL